MLVGGPARLWASPDYLPESAQISAQPVIDITSRYASWHEIIREQLPAPDWAVSVEPESDWQSLYRAPPGDLVGQAPDIACRYPIDIGRQWRMAPEFSPSFLPEFDPGRNWDEWSYDDYVNSSWLQQRGWANPYRIAAQEVQQMNEDDDLALKRVALATAYWWTRRQYEDAELETLEAVLGRPQYLCRDLLADLVAPRLLALLPDSLTEVTSGEGMVPIDLRVASNTSFDSAAAMEKMLLRAAQRGLKAVVIADRNRIDGAQRAQQTAARLRAQGKLPADFRVIVGEYVDTTSGGVLALFVRTWVPEQMTMKKTLEMIHDQGALAIMAHPGVAGGPRMLRQMPFDGYLIQAGLFEMFRTLQVLYEPALVGKPALYGSNTTYSEAVGIPYTMIEADDTSEESLRQALVEGRAYAAGAMYLPWMIAATIKPIGKIETTLNSYFVAHDEGERRFLALLGADNVKIRLSWDRELQGWMGMDRLAEGMARLANGTSPLLELPQIEELALEYSYFQLKYSSSGPTYSLSARCVW